MSTDFSATKVHSHIVPCYVSTLPLCANWGSDRGVGTGRGINIPRASHEGVRLRRGGGEIGGDRRRDVGMKDHCMSRSTP